MPSSTCRIISMCDKDSAQRRRAFLAGTAFADGELNFLAGDASPRRYYRVRKGEQHSVLMDADPRKEPLSLHHGAPHTQRIAAGYGAQARLAGLHPGAFFGLSAELCMRGFSAPQIYAADAGQGLALLEDLGDTVVSAYLSDHPEQEEAIYTRCIDVLIDLARASFPRSVSGFGHDWTIHDYDGLALCAEASLFLDWYLPSHGGVALDATARDKWLKAVDAIYMPIAKENRFLVLRDVHADNLLWLPEREGHGAIGLLDFQDALFGHAGYDMMSLLDDARRDVSPSIKEALITRFANGLMIADKDAFRRDCALISIQRLLKILGIFERLAKRDGKTGYRAHIPRVEGLLRGHLAWLGDHPLCDLIKQVCPVLAQAGAVP